MLQMMSCKSKMAAAPIFNFGKILIVPDWIKTSAPNFMEDASRPCGDDHVTKSRNRKLIHLTSSNKGLKHMCIYLRDYNIIFEPNLSQNTNTTLSAWWNSQIYINWKSKMAAAAILNFGKMSITPDWIKISVPNCKGRCTTAMRRWPRDQKSKPEVNSPDVIKWRSWSICASISGSITLYLNQICTEHKYHAISTME